MTQKIPAITLATPLDLARETVADLELAAFVRKHAAEMLVALRRAKRPELALELGAALGLTPDGTARGMAKCAADALAELRRRGGGNGGG